MVGNAHPTQENIMITFSKDIDLLRWEPVLFGELALPSQRLCEGNDGAMAQTTFTSAAADFTACDVHPGHVLCAHNADYSLQGCYEIVAVDPGAPGLTVSILRADADAPTVAPPAGTDLQFHISSYAPLAHEIAESLLQYFDLANLADEPEQILAQIANPQSLRQTSVFGVLTAVFAARATGANDPAGLWDKAMHYRKQFETARARVRLQLDPNGDQIIDRTHTGGSIRLRRA